MKTIQRSFLSLALLGLLASGCDSLNRTQKGAVVGAAGGGAIGGVIGRAVGNTAAGVLIGAAVGGTAGAVIGRRMDQQAEEMKRVLGDAEVRREGEGIVIEFKEKVLFGFNQSGLNSTSRASLDQLTDVLTRYPETNIEVLGHTDSRGAANYNERLSVRRASAVADYLRNRGIASSRLVTRGLGESDPKASNETESGRAENRRVEFVITANEQMKAQARQESGN